MLTRRAKAYSCFDSVV